MKKLLLSFVVILLFSIQLSAQTFSAKAGLNISSRYYGKDCALVPTDYSYIPGIHAGAYYETGLNRKLSLNGGLVLNSRGYRVHNGTQCVYIDQIQYKLKEETNRFMFLDLCLNLKLNHKINRRISIYGYTGPYLGFALTGHSTQVLTRNYDELSVRVHKKEIEPRKSNEPWIDYGLTLGGGVSVKNFLFETSFSGGLRNAGGILKNPGTPNLLFSLSVGYRF